MKSLLPLLCIDNHQKDVRLACDTGILHFTLFPTWLLAGGRMFSLGLSNGKWVIIFLNFYHKILIEEVLFFLTFDLFKEIFPKFNTQFWFSLIVSGQIWYYLFWGINNQVNHKNLKAINIVSPSNSFCLVNTFRFQPFALSPVLSELLC